jgi:hypothetical protein
LPTIRISLENSPETRTAAAFTRWILYSTLFVGRSAAIDATRGDATIGTSPTSSTKRPAIVNLSRSRGRQAGWARRLPPVEAESEQQAGRASFLLQHDAAQTAPRLLDRGLHLPGGGDRTRGTVREDDVQAGDACPGPGVGCPRSDERVVLGGYHAQRDAHCGPAQDRCELPGYVRVASGDVFPGEGPVVVAE